jgi:hypothetical protein
MVLCRLLQAIPSPSKFEMASTTFQAQNQPQTPGIFFSPGRLLLLSVLPRVSPRPFPLRASHPHGFQGPLLSQLRLTQSLRFRVTCSWRRETCLQRLQRRPRHRHGSHGPLLPHVRQPLAMRQQLRLRPALSQPNQATPASFRGSPGLQPLPFLGSSHLLRFLLFRFLLPSLSSQLSRFHCRNLDPHHQVFLPLRRNLLSLSPCVLISTNGISFTKRTATHPAIA